MKTIKLTNSLQAISDAVEQVDGLLHKYKVSEENRIRSTLTLEETLVKIAESTTGSETPIFISIRRSLHRIELRITVSCHEINFSSESLIADSDMLLNEYGPETENLIRDLILRNNAERIHTRYARGVNRIDILVSQNEKAMFYETMVALVLGIGAGLATRFWCSPEMMVFLNTYLFTNLYSLFITAIAMIMVPMVFFSLVSSVSGFSDLSTLGRTGGKVLGLYFTTALIALGTVFFYNAIIAPGQPGMMTLPEANSTIESLEQPSLADRLMNIIPTNFVGAFGSADMLQIIFLAVLLGIACTQIGKSAQSLKNAFESLAALFSRATTLISHFLPYAIFGVMAQMALTVEVSGMGALASWIGVMFLCMFTQVAIYMFLVWINARVNPFIFIRKYMPAYITALFTSSGSVTMPMSIACCQKLGISRKIYSLSIPLGANINMDGESIFFSVTTLFLAGLYGIHLDAATILSFIFSVMLISVATPGVPGAGTACILMLFAVIGLPAEAFGLVLGLLPILELFKTCLNIIGDGAVTTIVAKSEGELDEERYNAD